jgi:hypothetical protein
MEGKVFPAAYFEFLLCKSHIYLSVSMKSCVMIVITHRQYMCKMSFSYIL